MATIAERFGDADRFVRREDSESSRLFQAMEDIPPGGTLTYDDLDRILGRDFKSNRGPFATALRRWHSDKPAEGTWVNVQRIGYQRTATWTDAKDAGRGHESRMRSQARKSKARYKAGDPSTMTDQEREEQGQLLARIGRLETAMRSTKRDVAQLRKSKADRDEVTELREQMTALTEAVERLSGGES